MTNRTKNNNKYRQSHLENGLCIRCPNKLHSKTMCKKCLKKHSKYKYYYRRKVLKIKQEDEFADINEQKLNTYFKKVMDKEYWDALKKKGIEL